MLVITLQDKQTFSDISIIIKMMPKSMQSKINPKFINFIENNKDYSYKSSIDKNTPIKNQVLSSNTQTMLALIYRDYLCSDEEREKLLSHEKQELEKIEEEKRKKYKINFEKKNSSQDTSVSNALIAYKKENILTKLVNIIKKFLNFN